jgi:hypothetical protein
MVDNDDCDAQEMLLSGVAWRPSERKKICVLAGKI